MTLPWPSKNEPPQRVPWPAEWTPLRRASGIATTAFFGLVTATCIAAAASGFGDPRAYIMAAAIPLFLGLTLLGTCLRVRVRTRSTNAIRTVATNCPSGPALVVPFSLTACVTMWLLGIGMVLTGGTVAVLCFLVAFTSDTIDAGLVLVGIVTAVVAVTALAFLAEAVLGRLIRGALIISPEAVTYRTWGADIAVMWSDITAIEAIPNPTNRTIAVSSRRPGGPAYRYRSFLWKPLRKTARVLPFLPVPGALLATDPALAYQALRFYFAYPNARTELGTRAAEQRVRSGTVAFQ